MTVTKTQKVKVDSGLGYKALRALRAAKNILKSRFATHSPVCLTHVITDFCNLKCSKCDVWIVQKNKDIREELSTSEILGMIDQAAEAGVVSYTIWGGEPLMRKDIEVILEYAHSKKMFISLITNGYFLPEKWKIISDTVDYLIVSIDGAGRLHDDIAGVDNCYARAIEGIKRIKEHTKVIVNCVISTMNFEHLEPLIDEVKNLGLKMTFEPIQRWEGINELLLLNDEQRKKTFGFLGDKLKNDTVILNSMEYFNNFTQKKTFTCHASKVFITVKANGDISSCRGKSWGNVRNTHMKEVFVSAQYASFCKENESCNKCSVSCVVETSEAYELNPKLFARRVRQLISSSKK